jgi:hypothetical protein
VPETAQASSAKTTATLVAAALVASALVAATLVAATAWALMSGWYHAGACSCDPTGRRDHCQAGREPEGKGETSGLYDQPAPEPVGAVGAGWDPK